MKDFFISYNKADRRWAEWIAWRLEEAGYTTVLQAWDFGPGSNFVLEMQKATVEADRTIAVLSPDYLASRFTTPEWAAAFAQDPTGSGRTLVPIRVRECDPAGLLGPIVQESLVGLDERAATAALLAAVKRGRAKPDAAPAFPPAAGRAVPSPPRFPGALPPIWNVPHLRNPNFTGREDLLARLHASLTSGNHAALTQAMHGLGGVGKTQTAIEYAYRYAAEYQAILWVPAEDAAALAGHFAALGSALGLDVDPADQPGTVAEVLRWFRENPRWLLVFDNAEGADGIRPYLPQAGTGHVIITSRNPHWRRFATPVDVPCFVPEEGAEFLLARAGVDDAGPSERAAALQLASELGGLAIALEQAAAYVEAHGLSLAAYLDLFNHHREKVLSRDVSADYPHTIETVWALSIDAVRSASPAAADLLALLAFLAPDQVPLALIRAGAQGYPEPLAASASDELKLREATRILRRHSLIQLQSDSLSVHRLVQAITRHALSRAEQCRYSEAAMNAVEAALPPNPTDPETWTGFSGLMSHVSTAAGHCASLGVALQAASVSLNQAGRYLNSRADYEAAVSYFVSAVRNAERALGADAPAVGNCLGNLGQVYMMLGHLELARTTLEQALKITSANPASDQKDLAGHLNSLGMVSEMTGDHPAALAYYVRASRMIENAFGSDDGRLAYCMNNLGSVHQELENFSDARRCYERALAIHSRKLGPGHPEVAVTMNNLGTLCMSLGEIVQARGYIEAALRIDEAVFGPVHRNIARRLDNLAYILEAQGDRAGAREHLHRALSICREIFGSGHPATLQLSDRIDGLAG